MSSKIFVALATDDIVLGFCLNLGRTNNCHCRLQCEQFAETHDPEVTKQIEDLTVNRPPDHGTFFLDRSRA